MPRPRLFRKLASALALFGGVGLWSPAVGAKAVLKEGDVAPAFNAKGDDGRTYTLGQFKGRTVVLYFYPKDDTPGCTVEAQHFRDDAKAYEHAGAVVLGVSYDDAKSHTAFRQKHGLAFPLLVGNDALADAYGVPVRFGYASRQTFVIGRDGRIARIFRDVDVSTHSSDVLKSLP
jgi:peroxiredoxin Q/BCP